MATTEREHAKYTKYTKYTKYSILSMFSPLGENNNVLSTLSNAYHAH